MPKSKFFRVAVEGATVDGRTIDRKWLEEMAATYNPATYAARVNLEHIRGASPLSNQTPFGSYGNVLALKTEEITLSIGGQDQKKLALFAEIEALDPLVALNKAGQKLYTSVEINPSFADTGKAYLMGIAVTDTPASLGTEMLEFSAKLGDKSPLAARKQQPGNFFSVAEEASIELVEEGPADPTGVLASLKSLLDRFTQTPPEPKPEPKPEVKPDAAPAAGDFAVLGVALGQMAGAIDKLATSTAAQLTAITDRVGKVETQLSATPAPNQPSRQPATGLSETYAKTDC